MYVFSVFPLPVPLPSPVPVDALEYCHTLLSPEGATNSDLQGTQKAGV